MRTWVRSVLAIALAVAGCGKQASGPKDGPPAPSAADKAAAAKAAFAPVLAKHRAAVAPMLDALAQIGKLAAAAPPTGKRVVPAPAVAWDGGKAWLVVHLDELDPGGKYPRPGVGITENLDFKRLAGAYATGSDDTYTPPSIDGAFAELETKKYVAVIRILAAHAPEVQDRDHFAGGIAEGDILYYEIATKKPLGATPYLVRNSDALQIQGIERKDQLQHKVDEDFRSAYRDGVIAEVAAGLDGSTSAATPKPETPAQLQARQIRELLFARSMFVQVTVTADAKGCNVVLAPTTAVTDNGKLKAEVTAAVTQVMTRKCDVSTSDALAAP